MKVQNLFNCFNILIIDLCKMSFIVVVCVVVSDRLQVASTFVTAFERIGICDGCRPKKNDFVTSIFRFISVVTSNRVDWRQPLRVPYRAEVIRNETCNVETDRHDNVTTTINIKIIVIK